MTTYVLRIPEGELPVVRPPLLWSTEPTRPVASVLFVVVDHDGAYRVRAEPIDLNPAALAQQLGSSDFEAREAFFDDLVVRLGVRDAEARNAENWLRERATGTDELAWTARLVLREAERRGGGFSGDPLAMVLGKDSPATLGLAEFVAAPASPLQNHFPATTQASRPEGALDFEARDDHDLEVVLEQLRVNRFPVGDLEEHGDFTFELRCGPEQALVRVLEVPEVASSNGGLQRYKTQVREYHGRSLDEILRAHPDLANVLPYANTALPQAPAAPPADVLGVFVEDAEPGERVEVLGEAGQVVRAGVVVLRVEPGTIAEDLGLGRGSLLLRVGDHPIVDDESISSALSAAKASQTGPQGTTSIRVEWLDPWNRRQARTWRGVLAR